MLSSFLTRLQYILPMHWKIQYEPTDTKTPQTVFAMAYISARI